MKIKLPLLLDRIAQRYHKLPSELLDLTIEDLQINVICYEIGCEEDERQIKKLEK
ncbi:MAG: hypothetical protein QXJ14_03520 [Candidatus Aenigmatarchaeota archaeon]